MCVFSSDSFWTSSSLDVPAGVTQEEGHTGFFIHLLSAMRALIFLARRIQPFLSLVDREVEFCVIVLHPLAIFCFCFLVFLGEKSRLPGLNSRPNVSEGYEVPLSYRGDRLLGVCVCVFFPSILDINGRTSRGHTGGRSHRIFNPPSFCGACLDFCREKDSAIPFPRRP